MPEQRSGWSREFDEPIAVPDGGTLVTLRDAADYITALPDEEAALPEWQAAIEALMLVADLGGPTMFARIGVMRALNRHHVRVFNPARKDHHLGSAKFEAGRMTDMSNFDDLTSGWEMSVTMQLRTPLKWLQRHREFHAGTERPSEALPPEHACWVPVPKSWRELGIDEDELPSSTMASQIGQIPVDGGDFLAFLMEYRMIVEGAAEALGALGERHPRYAALLAEPARRVRKRKA